MSATVLHTTGELRFYLCHSDTNQTSSLQRENHTLISYFHCISTVNGLCSEALMSSGSDITHVQIQIQLGLSLCCTSSVLPPSPHSLPILTSFTFLIFPSNPITFSPTHSSALPSFLFLPLTFDLSESVFFPSCPIPSCPLALPIHLFTPVFRADQTTTGRC